MWYIAGQVEREFLTNTLFDPFTDNLTGIMEWVNKYLM